MSRSPLFSRISSCIALLTALALSACAALEPTATPTRAPTPTSTATPAAPPATPTPAPLPTAVPEPTQRGTLRLFHAAPALQAVDIYIEGSIIAQRLGYGEFSLPVALNEGEYTLRVLPSRADPEQNEPLVRERVRIRAGDALLYVLRPAGETLRALRYPQDVRKTALGEGRVAALNALVDDVALSVFLDQDIPIGAAQSGGQGTTAREVIARRYTARFLSNNQTVLAAPFTLAARNSVFLILYGTLAQPRLATLSLPTLRESQLRILNANWRLPRADVYLDERLVAEGIAFGGLSEPLSLASRTYRLRVLPSGAAPDSPPLFEGALPLAEDRQLLLAIFSERFEDRSRLRTALFTEPLDLPPQGSAHLSVLNLARQETTIQALDPTAPLSAPVPYGALSAPIALSAGRQRLAFNTLEETPRTVETAEVALEAGWSYIYVVLSSLNTPPILIGTNVQALFAALPTPTISSGVRVRLVNAAAEPLNVDLAVGETLLFTAVPVNSSTATRPIESAMRPVRLLRSETGEVLAEQTLLFAPNGNLVFVVLGRQGAWRLLQSQERARPSRSNAALRVIHAAPDAEPISLESPLVASRVAIFGDRPTPTPRAARYFARLEYGNISSIVTLRNNTYTFVARSAIDGAPLAELRDVAIEANARYDLLLVRGDSGLPRDVRLVLLKAQDD
ncbi:MAG: DUF4397 domain-containing protein [Chloroflexi bacterium]|nr:DUF4397 domain-containing protein [Chloroflexota bacterium]